MRLMSVAAIALVLATGGALAQNPPANDGPNNKAINSKSENNLGAPVAERIASPKVKLSRASS